jgi:hypothetical protein
MDGTDLRLMFVLGLVALTIGIALLARAVDWLVASWRASRQAVIKRGTRSAPVATSETSRPSASREGAVATTALTSARGR